MTASRRGLPAFSGLLVIAGYDANPIDGVQGAKTQAALNKFLNDRKLAADAASGAGFLRGADRGGAQPGRPRLCLVQ